MLKLGLVLILVVLMTPLASTRAHAADLLPNIDLIPDPNLEDLNDFPDPIGEITAVIARGWCPGQKRREALRSGE